MITLCVCVWVCVGLRVCMCVCIVLQARVNRKTVGQKVVKLTYSPPCWPSGNCYYDWYRNNQYIGCSYGASLWLDSTSSSDQDSYTCEVKNSRPQQHCKCQSVRLSASNHGGTVQEEI